MNIKYGHWFHIILYAWILYEYIDLPIVTHGLLFYQLYINVFFIYFVIHSGILYLHEIYNTSNNN